MSESEPQLSRQVYRLRVLGLALGSLPVGTVFHERGAPPVAWIGLAAYAFVWPHVAYYLARNSADPHRTERTNLSLDSALGGVWVALMQFSLLPSVLLVTMLSMDKLAWGMRFLARASAGMVAACAVTMVVVGTSFHPSTSMPAIVASIPLMVAYPLAVALAVNRSGRLARERRRAVEQTVELREQLAHIARVGTLGEMAAGLAHELNQPLTAIQLEAGAALEIAAQNDVEGMRECLSRISAQSLRAGEIVRRMRAFSRRGQSTRRRLEIGQLVHEVLALLDHDLRLGGVDTTLDLREHVPPVLGDRVEIQQVLVNLIRNAIEAMERPSVTHRRLTIRTEALNGNVRVTVTDTGGGVDPAIVSRLFHPFQSMKPAGLGLGLSICQTLIEAHGGRVGAGPHPHGGAAFFFEIPAAQEKAA